MISKEAVVQVCNLIERHVEKHTGPETVLNLVKDLRKVKSNKSYANTMRAIESELRWRFGKDY